MRRNNSRRARQVPSTSIGKFGLGLLMMGLALTASAKDGATAEIQPTPSAAIRPKTSLPPTALPKTSPRISGRGKRWFQIGLASWYGSHFQGRQTAAGESFDMNSMTCAHPTLPMGTWLRVTNLRNRKTAFVRVNDRGPVLEDRIVDLSFAAAKTLGLAGVGQVRLEAVRSGDPVLAQALLAQLQMPTPLDPLFTH